MQPFSAHHTQKVYPLVRPLRLLLTTGLMATGLLGGFLLWRAAKDTGPPTSEKPLIVAWVDFDIPPVRQGVARFTQHLKAQRPEGARPVEVELIGVDADDPARFAMKMRQLIATQPALIFASSVGVTKTLLALKTSIPIYFGIQSDPVRDGLVPSLVSTGSLTGYTFFVPLDVEIMELVRRVFPLAERIGVVADPDWLEGSFMSRDLFPQAKALGLDLRIFNLQDPIEIGRLLEDPRARDVQVWYIPYTAMAFNHGKDIAQV